MSGYAHFQNGSRLCENVREQRLRRIVFCRVPILL
jgi:hypothetical protein